ncbi:replication protein P [Zooshikella ganghwensis]|uniref:Replication protein P n=1 Tax=Zooshikella ganghwensis TaxID=202772 RepID=A0A4P9VG92_9GAMM|nr:replication protein P [Zooshikella ganghwensis]RDH41426.1 Replication protein P [Zooshikella ganghwensis]
MRQAGAITRQIDYNQLPQAEVKQAAPDARGIAIQLINGVFKELKGCCSAWSYTFPDTETLKVVKQQWIKTFIENGISSDQQINIGMAKVRKLGSPYVPTPGEFVRYCQPQPEDYGLPSAEIAYREACQYSHNPTGAKWSHEAVYQAAKATGWFELKVMEERRILPLFERNYEIVTRRVLAGEPLSSIPKALPGQVHKTPAERNKAYYDAKQAEQIKQADLSHLTDGHNALAKMRAIMSG